MGSDSECVLCERNSSYSYSLIVLKLCTEDVVWTLSSNSIFSHFLQVMNIFRRFRCIEWVLIVLRLCRGF